MDLKEYGYKKTLQEILEELALHCQIITGKSCNIKLILPDEVVEDYTKQFYPVEKTSPLEKIYSTNDTTKQFHTNGIIELLKESEQF
jgi:hypothetical protein